MSEPVSSLSIALQSDKPLSQYAELASLIESFGFGTLSIYADLMFQPPLPALLEAARATSRIRLGPACLNPFTLHPVEMAGQVAMLDWASNGRAYLGIARGAWLDSLGLNARHPVAAVMEAVEVVRRLLSGDSDGFEGEVFRLARGQRLEYPVLRPAVPVLVGTWGPQLAHAAGAIAHELKVGGSANPRMVGMMNRPLSSAAISAGRSNSAGVVLGAVTVVDEDRAAARALARREVARYLPVVGPLDPTVTIEPELLSRIESLVRVADFDTAGSLISDNLLDLFAFAGTPRDVAAQAEAVLAAGAARVEFGTPHGLTPRNGLTLLGRQVLPRFR